MSCHQWSDVGGLLRLCSTVIAIRNELLFGLMKASWHFTYTYAFPVPHCVFDKSWREMDVTMIPLDQRNLSDLNISCSQSIMEIHLNWITCNSYMKTWKHSKLFHWSRSMTNKLSFQWVTQLMKCLFFPRKNFLRGLEWIALKLCVSRYYLHKTQTTLAKCTDLNNEFLAWTYGCNPCQ